MVKELTVYKYLGIEFNKNCTFEEFKSRVLDKARKNRGVLGSFGSTKGSLSVAANITLWEGVIRTGMEYGAEIWGEGQWEEAEMIQREVGRRILGCSKMTSNAAVRGVGLVESIDEERVFNVKILAGDIINERRKIGSGSL